MPPTSLRARLARASRDPRVWRRTLVLGLPVGLLQVTLNQGDHWWRQEITTAIVAKSIFSPLLSCAIAFASAAVSRPIEPDPTQLS